MEKERKSKIAEKFTTLIFYLSILIFFIAFNFQDSRTGGWVQQFLPNLPGNPPIKDITFVDSLIGYAITYGPGGNDTDYVLKTTNGGSNWLIIRTEPGPYNGFERLFFLNKDTGYIASYVGIASNISNLQKTVNGGLNWINIYWPTSAEPSDLFVLNTDTIWMCSPSSTGGGLYRTINGGLNWQLQYGACDKIYMYNSRIGFMSAGGSFLKTTNSGYNWTQISGVSDYTDIYFIDSLRGFKAKYIISKTTNGGLNWQDQIPPVVQGGLYTSNQISKFSYFNDTIYGAWGSVTYPNFHTSAIVYKTTNEGVNWGYQIPDTNYNIGVLHFTKFISGKKGWCYINNGIKTYTGGDSTIIVNVNSVSNNISKDYVLYQNYPNPFNPKSNIKYKIEKTTNVKLIVFDITGKEITTLVNSKQNTGEYNVIFNGSNLSSGIYFYSLFVDGIRVDTKKMLMIK